MDKKLKCLFGIGLLSVVREPHAFGYFHIRKCCFERRIFRAARIYAKADNTIAFAHMAYPHLFEQDAVFRTLNAIIVFAAAESVPH